MLGLEHDDQRGRAAVPGPTNSMKFPSGSRKTVRYVAAASDCGNAIGHLASGLTPVFLSRVTAASMSFTPIVI